MALWTRKSPQKAAALYICLGVLLARLTEVTGDVSISSCVELPTGIQDAIPMGQSAVATPKFDVLYTGTADSSSSRGSIAVTSTSTLLSMVDPVDLAFEERSPSFLMTSNDGGWLYMLATIYKQGPCIDPSAYGPPLLGYLRFDVSDLRAIRRSGRLIDNSIAVSSVRALQRLDGTDFAIFSHQLGSVDIVALNTGSNATVPPMFGVHELRLPSSSEEALAVLPLRAAVGFALVLHDDTSGRVQLETYDASGLYAGTPTPAAVAAVASLQLAPAGTTLQFAAAASGADGITAVAFQDTATKRLMVARVLVSTSTLSINSSYFAYHPTVTLCCGVAAGRMHMSFERSSANHAYLALRNASSVHAAGSQSILLEISFEDPSPGSVVFYRAYSQNSANGRSIDAVITPRSLSGATNNSVLFIETQPFVGPELSQAPTPIPPGTSLRWGAMTPYGSNDISSLLWHPKQPAFIYGVTDSGGVFKLDAVTRSTVDWHMVTARGVFNALAYSATAQFYSTSAAGSVQCLGVFWVDDVNHGRFAVYDPLTMTKLYQYGLTTFAAEAGSGQRLLPVALEDGISTIVTSSLVPLTPCATLVSQRFFPTSSADCSLSVNPALAVVVPGMCSGGSFFHVTAPAATFDSSAGMHWVLRGVSNDTAYGMIALAVNVGGAQGFVNATGDLGKAHRGFMHAAIGHAGTTSFFLVVSSAITPTATIPVIKQLRWGPVWTFMATTLPLMAPATPFNSVDGLFFRSPYIFASLNAGESIGYFLPAPGTSTLQPVANLSLSEGRPVLPVYGLALSPAGAASGVMPTMVLGDIDSAPGFTWVRSLDVSPAPSVSPSVTPSRTASPSRSASATVTPSLSASVPASPSTAATASGTPSRSGSTTPSPSPSWTPSASGSGSPAVTPSVSATIAGSVTASSTPSVSAGASSSASGTVTPSLSRLATPSESPSRSLSRSPSVSGSVTGSSSAAGSVSVSTSPSPSITSSTSASRSPSLSSSASPSLTGSVTASSTASGSTSPSVMASPSPSLSLGASASNSPAGTSSPTVSHSAAASGSVSPSRSGSSSASGSVSPSRSGSASGSGSRTGTPSTTRSPNSSRSSSKSPSVSSSESASATSSPSFGASSSSSGVPPSPSSAASGTPSRAVSASATAVSASATLSLAPSQASLPPLLPSPSTAASGAVVDCTDSTTWSQRYLLRLQLHIRLPVLPPPVSASVPQAVGPAAMNSTAPVAWLCAAARLIDALAAASMGDGGGGGGGIAAPMSLALAAMGNTTLSSSGGGGNSQPTPQALPPVVAAINASVMPQQCPGDSGSGQQTSPAPAGSGSAARTALVQAIARLANALSGRAVAAALGNGGDDNDDDAGDDDGDGDDGPAALAPALLPGGGGVDALLLRSDQDDASGTASPSTAPADATPSSSALPSCQPGAGGSSSSGASSCLSNAYAPPRLLATYPVAASQSQLVQALAAAPIGALLSGPLAAWPSSSSSLSSSLLLNSTVVSIAGFIDPGMSVGEGCLAASNASSSNRRLQASASSLSPVAPAPQAMLSLLQSAAGSCALAQADGPAATLPLVSCSSVALLAVSPFSFGPAAAAAFPAAIVVPPQPQPQPQPLAPSADAPSPSPSPSDGGGGGGSGEDESARLQLLIYAGAGVGGLVVLVLLALAVAACIRFARTYRAVKKRMAAQAAASLLRVAAAERALTLAAAGAADTSAAGLVDMLSAAFPPAHVAADPVYQAAFGGAGAEGEGRRGADAAARRRGQGPGAGRQMTATATPSSPEGTRSAVAQAALSAFQEAAAAAHEDGSDAAAAAAAAASPPTAAVPAAPELAASKQRALAAICGSLPGDALRAAVEASLKGAQAAVLGAQAAVLGAPAPSADAAAAPTPSGGGRRKSMAAASVSASSAGGGASGDAASASSASLPVPAGFAGPRVLLARVMARAVADAEAALRSALGPAALAAAFEASGADCARFADMWDEAADCADAALPATTAVPLAAQMETLAAAGGSSEADNAKAQAQAQVRARSNGNGNGTVAMSTGRRLAEDAVPALAPVPAPPLPATGAGRVAALRAAIESRMREAAAAKDRVAQRTAVAAAAAAVDAAAAAAGSAAPSRGRRTSSAVAPAGDGDGEVVAVSEGAFDAEYEMARVVEDGNHGDDDADPDADGSGSEDGHGLARTRRRTRRSTSSAGGDGGGEGEGFRRAGSRARLSRGDHSSTRGRAGAVEAVSMGMAAAKRAAQRGAAGVAGGAAGAESARHTATEMRVAALTPEERARSCLRSIVLVSLSAQALHTSSALKGAIRVEDEAAARLVGAAAAMGAAAAAAPTPTGSSTSPSPSSPVPSKPAPSLARAAAALGLSPADAASISAAAMAGVSAGDEIASRAAAAAAGLAAAVTAVDTGVRAAARKRAWDRAMALVRCGKASAAAQQRAASSRRVGPSGGRVRVAAGKGKAEDGNGAAASSSSPSQDQGCQWALEIPAIAASLGGRAAPRVGSALQQAIDEHGNGAGLGLGRRSTGRKSFLVLHTSPLADADAAGGGAGVSMGVGVKLRGGKGSDTAEGAAGGLAGAASLVLAALAQQKAAAATQVKTGQVAAAMRAGSVAAALKAQQAKLHPASASGSGTASGMVGARASPTAGMGAGRRQRASFLPSITSSSSDTTAAAGAGAGDIEMVGFSPGSSPAGAGHPGRRTSAAAARTSLVPSAYGHRGSIASASGAPSSCAGAGRSRSGTGSSHLYLEGEDGASAAAAASPNAAVTVSRTRTARMSGVRTFASPGSLSRNARYPSRSGVKV